MQHSQRPPLTSMRPDSGHEREHRREPVPLPHRSRIRRLAAIYQDQLRASQSAIGNVDEIARQQADALREFSLELSRADSITFMNIFTEESSALEREWIFKRRKWRSPGELSPTLVLVLVFAVTIFAIALAIKYAV